VQILLRKCEQFLELYQMLKVSYTLVFTHSLYLFLKLGAALLIGPVENCSISFPVQFSIQKLLSASDEAFKKFVHRSSPDTISLYSKLARIKWPLFLRSHLEAVLVQVVRGRVQCAQSPIHLTESAASFVWQQAVKIAVWNELWKQKLINNFNYCLQQHYH